MAGMDLDVEVVYEAAWVEPAPMEVEGEEECSVEVTMHDNGDVSVVTQTSESFDSDHVVAVTVSVELTKETEGEFTPILQRGGKKQFRRQKSVTFSDDVQIYYIENANLGRKVSEICSPKKAPAPTPAPSNKNMKIYKCVTANGTVFVEMDDVAVEYLSFIQQERNSGREVVVKDFFKEAKQHAELKQQQAVAAMCDDDLPDIDLYNASKQRYRPPRPSRKFQQQRSGPNGNWRDVHSPQDSAESEEDCNSDPDIPSAAVGKEEVPAHGSPKSSHRQGRRNSGTQRQGPCHSGEQQSQWVCQQDTLMYKQRQRYSQMLPHTAPASPSQPFAQTQQYQQGWQRKPVAQSTAARQTPPRGPKPQQQNQRFSRSLK